MPRSTMLTGISGSSTSRSASRSASSAIRVRLAEAVELLLERGDHLGVARSAAAPALDDVVPRAGVAEVPALGLGIEGAREGVVEHVRVALAVRGHAEADVLAVGDDQREPPLPELVVGLALEPVVELRGVRLDAVGQAEPLDGQREHPVDRPLELVLRGAAGLRHPLGPGAAVAEVEVLLQHHLVEAALPGAVGALLVD